MFSVIALWISGCGGNTDDWNTTHRSLDLAREIKGLEKCESDLELALSDGKLSLGEYRRIEKEATIERAKSIIKESRKDRDKNLELEVNQLLDKGSKVDLENKKMELRIRGEKLVMLRKFKNLADQLRLKGEEEGNKGTDAELAFECAASSLERVISEVQSEL